MFFLLLSKKRKRKSRKSVSDKDNSRFPHKRFRKHSERQSFSDDFLRASDRRKKLVSLRNIDGTPIQMEVMPSNPRVVQSRTHFVNAQKNPICIRRSNRRKLLFAVGFAGRGKVKNAKWSENSKVVCK